jgi:phosphatidylglycerophosphate synthase
VTEKPYVPERRPIASRERAFSKRLASWLVRRDVSANAISVTGMVCGVAGGVAFGLSSFPEWERVCLLAAAALMQLRLLCNMLDGMVAVQTGKASPAGELYNEVPDRVSDAAICIGAGYAYGSLPELGYLAACVALFVAYVRAEGKVAGAHQEFCGPMAKQQRMFLLTLVALYGALTPHGWQPVVAPLAIGNWSPWSLGDLRVWWRDQVAAYPPPLGLVGLALLVIIVGGLFTAVRRLARISRALRRAQS